MSKWHRVQREKPVGGDDDWRSLQPYDSLIPDYSEDFTMPMTSVRLIAP